MRRRETQKLGLMASIGLLAIAASGQVIDPLTGSLSSYTGTLVLDNSGGASGVSFSDSSSGLQASFVGGTSAAEQALFLAPTGSFSSVFSVGQMLTVNVSVPTSLTNVQMDLGLAISATATPTAAGANGNTRPSFDWASISVRPTQGSIRANSSISGSVVTSAGVINNVNPTTVSQLFIQWNSPYVFTLGYIDSSNAGHISESVTFASGSTIGAAIGFYGDLRASGASLGYLNNLAIAPIPEPTSLALTGLAIAAFLFRRKLA